jgi:enoyl-CoA hydratase/carnithine racemase
MQDCSQLLFEVADGVAMLTLNRPEQGNALTVEMLTALEQAWMRVEAEPYIVVAIITGAGERHFCTGAAVGELAVGVGGLQHQPHRVANRFAPRMSQVSKPVICVVNGLVNAAGLNFVAESDIVVCSANAEFMDTHVSIGLVSGIEQVGIARRAGVGAALLMALAGRAYRMSAKRAHELGIVDLLEPSVADAMVRAHALAKGICANSPQALALTKRAIWASTEMTDPMAATYAWELVKSHWSHPDFGEGPRAFVEKRQPRWNADPKVRSVLDARGRAENVSPEIP